MTGEGVLRGRGKRKKGESREERSLQADSSLYTSTFPFFAYLNHHTTITNLTSAMIG